MDVGRGLAEVDWIISIDCTIVRAHQHVAEARKRGAQPVTEAIAVDGEGLGLFRGGLSIKIHLAVDGQGLRMAPFLTRGQDGDNPQMLPLVGRGPGFPPRD